MAERRILFREISGIRVLLSAFVLSLLFCATYAPLTFAEARQSTLTVQVSPQNLTIDTTPSAGGHFDHSSNSTISIVTDNYTGYRLSIASETTTNLVSEGNDTIPSITSAITETDFSTSGTYNNKWGYKPSQYIVDNNGVDTVVSNTSYYLPAPSTGTGDLIDVTSASNSTANTYTLSFGVRVDNTQPAGEYEYTYVITAVANAIVYNITYNASTNDTVNNMPTPNPQALTIDGGTPVADSHATLSSAEPTRNDMFFNGWCTVATTYNSATGNYDCSGTTYQPGDEYPIDQTVSGENITLYAIWMADPFPIVWSQMGACEFHGATNGNITGSECTDYHNVKFIDTGVPLYNTANYLKDYEIHMTIDHYDPNDQVDNQSGDNSQQTFVNDKLGSNAADGKAPGIVVRRSKTSIQFSSKMNDNQVNKTNTANRTNEFSVYRINNVIYYSVNGGSLIELQDITGFNQQFELTTWFGAYPSDGCTGSPDPCTNAKRIPEATFSNMYIKLGDFDESDYYAVTFNGNSGTPSASKYLVEDGSQIGTLPTATRTDWTFGGWYTAASGGTKITTSYVPTANTPLYAHWYKAVSQATITNDNISIDVGDTETINITNSAQLEPYTLVSSDTTVATVDQSTGVVTGVGAGTATITMTGTISHDTKTITVTVTQPVVQYTITFDPHNNNETSPWDETIDAGDDLTDVYPATDPTYTDHVFQGWWTAASGGTQISSSTQPSGTTTYHAQWKGTVALATVASDTIAITTNDTATVSVTNSADLEGFTFSSSDTSVATIDSTTGVITPLTAGTTNISITGTSSNTTNQIATVTVTQGVVQYTVYFNPHNGSANSSATVVAEQAIGSGNMPADPVNTDPEMIFMGWFTAASGGTEVTASTVPSADGETYHAQYMKIVCKLAKEGTLHTATRQSDSTPLTYGYIADNTTPEAGDAYDCDVDYNNAYSAVNERFYYVGQDSNNNAVLVAWNSYYNSNWAPGVSGSSGDTIFSYANALLQLPSNADGAWDNPGLIEQEPGKAARFTTRTEVATACGPNVTVTSTGEMAKCDYFIEHSTYDNNGRSALWLMMEGSTLYRIHGGDSNRNVTDAKANATSMVRPTIVVPYRLIEKYTPKYTVSFNAHGGTPAPADIQVAQGDTLGSVLNAMPTVTQSHYIFQNWYTAETGGTVVDLSTQPSGDVTYHAQWKKDVTLATFSTNQINMNNGSTTTINVTNAAELEEYTFSSNDTNVATVNSTTGVVTARGTGSTNIVMTGTTSHETISIGVVVVTPPAYYTITFDPQNGESSTIVVVTPGNTIGSANIPTVTYANHVLMRWYDTMTGDTVDGSVEPVRDMTVYAEWKLNVQQAVITNNDLTLSVGGSITVGVSNANLLEDYTFSSNNTLIATVDSSTGVITGVGVGTTNIVMTGTQSGLTKTLEVDVTAAPVSMHMVTFNTNGGSLDNGASSTRSVEDNTAVGTLPTASKTDYRFFGWYTDDGTFYDEVYADEIVDDDVIYYAKWVEDTSSLPIVWSEINACEFNGNAVISGNYCTQNKTKKMVDTGISLFNTTNYQKDFEIGFTIVEYNASSQSEGQATLVNSKYENSGVNYPGFVMRRTSNNFQLTSKWSSGAPTDATTSSTTLKTVRIVRQSGVLKYSFNGGALTTYYDTSSNTHRFDTRVWFGAASTSDNETPQRYLVGTLTDMYVRLGEISEYTVELDPGNGSLPSGVNSIYTITIGDPVGALPTPIAPGAGFTFDGWYYGNTLISDGTQFIPTSDVTLVAHYTSSSSLTPVLFDVTNAATRAYNSFITGLQPQISQFNLNTSPDPDYPNNKNYPERPAVNFSTWGVDKTTFLNGMKNIYESNNCKPLPGEDSQIDWGGGKTVDCSKPDAYDTNLNSALNVYLFDTTNQTHGSTTLDYIQASDGKIRNMIPGESYYWEDATDSSVYGVVTATSVNNRRLLDVGTVANVRDLGGLEVDTDGDGQIDGKLKYGKILRGGRLNTNANNIYILTNLGIDIQYNIAGETELYPTNNPDVKFGGAIPNTNPVEYYPGTYVNNEVIHYNFNYGTSGYNSTRTAVYNIMYDVARNHKNVYFHCRVGSDRTGTVAYLLEGLLGVPDELRYEDYELTSLAGNNDRTRYYDQKSRTNFYKFLYMMGYVLETDEIEAWFLAGSANQAADEQLIADFKAAMVDYYP